MNPSNSSKVLFKTLQSFFKTALDLCKTVSAVLNFPCEKLGSFSRCHCFPPDVSGLRLASAHILHTPIFSQFKLRYLIWYYSYIEEEDLVQAKTESPPRRDTHSALYFKFDWGSLRLFKTLFKLVEALSSLCQTCVRLFWTYLRFFRTCFGHF